MADDNDEEAEEEGPVVELGEGAPVEGAPLARVASRLHWPIQTSEIDRTEGDTTIRTSDGPRDLTDLLAEVDVTYFQSRAEFTDALRAVVGTDPIPTADE